MQRQNIATTFTEAITIPLTLKGCQIYRQYQQNKEGRENVLAVQLGGKDHLKHPQMDG
jgi:hypothetical protein